MRERKTTTGDVLGNHGTPVFLTYEGRRHPVAWPDLDVLDRTEKLVVRRAIDSIEALKGTLSPEEYTREKADLSALVRAGEHATGGRLWSQEFVADGGTRGLHMILWASLQEGRAKLQPVDAAKLPEIPFEDMPLVLEQSPDASVVVMQVLPDFCRAVAVRRRLPTAKMEERLKAILAAVAPTAPASPESVPPT